VTGRGRSTPPPWETRARRDTNLDDPAAVETLRLRHCATCRRTRGQPEPQRLRECERVHCRLRRLDRLRDEDRETWRTLRHIEGSHDPGLHDTVLEFLNDRIRRAGVATWQVGRTPAGGFTIAFNSLSLLSVLQSVLIGRIVGLGGDVFWNATLGNQEMLEGAASQARELVRERRREQQRARLAELHAQGRPIAEIARLMGWGKDRSLVNKELQALGLKEKGRKHTRM
jgi:hypothetical protein